MFKLYSLFDRKLLEYGQLLQARNDEAIKRNVLDGIKGSNSTVERYPEDFDVFCLGEFDAESGQIQAERARLVVNVATVLKPEGG